MENLIVINKDKKYYLNTFEELIELFLGKEYLSKNFEEKYKVRYGKAFGICQLNNIDLVDSRIGKIGSNGNILSTSYNMDNAFFINNEKTFILSICKFQNVVILESKQSPIFYDEKLGNIKEENNYIILNEFIDKLLLINL